MIRAKACITSSLVFLFASIAPRLIQAIPFDNEKQDTTGPKFIDYRKCTPGNPSTIYTGCNSPSFTQPADRKRKVAYWSVFDSVNPGYDDPFDVTLLDDLTHLILFSVNMTAFEDNQPLNWTHSEWKFPSDIFDIARKKKISVSVAFGGWGYDQQFKRMNSSQDGELVGNRIARFAMDNNIDGIDLDQEYPLAHQKDAWVAMIRTIKINAPNKTLSVAVPAAPVYHPADDAPLEQHVFAGYDAMLKEVEPSLDFINLMTYDMMNRYDGGRKAYHHAYLQGFNRTITHYENLGVARYKMNLGFANYAKWFSVADDKCEYPGNFGLNCTLAANLTDPTVYNSDAFKFRYLKNFQNVTDSDWTSKWASFNKTIGIETAEKGETYDPEAMANSAWDAEHRVFWTWQSPYAITQSCLAFRDMDIGGVMNFGLGQDTANKVHHDALFKHCVADWNKGL